jgi:hypothetical protein
MKRMRWRERAGERANGERWRERWGERGKRKIISIKINLFLNINPSQVLHYSIKPCLCLP